MESWLERTGLRIRAISGYLADHGGTARKGEVRLGQMHAYPTGALPGPHFVINFPTMGHSRERSRLDDIRGGLADLVRVVDTLGIKSIAVPPFGCDNGGLDWRDVGPLISSALEQLPAMELRATVHWVARIEDSVAGQDATAAVRLVGEWSRRKKRMFGPEHVTTAWHRLHDEGWFNSLVTA